MMEEVEYRWSGQVMETIDGLAFIGRNPLDADNIFIATGDSGMGMTHGTIAGMLLTDLILGRENPWATLYDPSRKTLRAAGEFVQREPQRRRQYADWVTGRGRRLDRRDPAETGAVMRRGLAKVAVYRDERAPCTSARRSARIWAASWTGTTTRKPGTAPATARASTGMAR